MTPDELRTSLETLQEKLTARGFDVRELIYEPPATEDEVGDLEEQLGLALPPSFRALLMHYSRHVHFRWFAPANTDYPAPFQSNFCGDLHWSLDFTEKFDKSKRGWIRDVFPNPDDPYDAVWHNKLAFYEVGNGDYLAVDLAPEKYEQIVYLSHDDGRGHGHVLAGSALDLLTRWVPLACTGGEDWQWIHFTDSLSGPIDPNGNFAKQWQWLLGIAG